jgi:hypothetical protein
MLAATMNRKAIGAIAGALTLAATGLLLWQRQRTRA